MKLKTSHAPAGKMKRLALAAAFIGSVAVANAQVAGDTFSYFYGQSGALGAAGGAGAYDFTEAAPSGFSSTNLLHATGATYDGGAGLGDGAMGLATGPNVSGNNRGSSIWSLDTLGGNNIGTGIDGSTETIQGVTLWININSIGNAANLPITLGIYDAADGYSTGTGGAPLGDLVGLTQALTGTGWVGIDIPLSVASSGFIISAQPGDNSGAVSAGSQQVSIFSTHPNSGALNTPGFSVNTMMVIPEPSTALLGSIGALALLRRRRK